MKISVLTNILILSAAVVVSSIGCGKVKHIPRLLVLKSYGENGEEKDFLVEEANAKFEQLSSDISDGSIKEGQTFLEVKETYGEPIKCDIVHEEGVQLSQCLYRFPTRFFKDDKAYLFFNQGESLVKWNLIEYKPNNKESSDE